MTRSPAPARRLPAPFLLLALACALGAPPAAAQGEEAGEAAAAEQDSLQLGAWDVALTGRLAGSQAAYRNWTEGGLSTLALTTSLSGKATRATQDWKQTYETRLAFGFVQQDTLDLRKAEDLIRLAAALQYRGQGFFRTFNPTVSVEARTQFASGFAYDEVPEGLPEETPLPTRVSAFLAPATFTEAVGLTYDPRPWFTQRLGIASKQTLVTAQRLRPIYGLRPGEAARVEAGLESVTEFDREVFTNVRLTSTLGLFAAFNKPDELPDVTWENIVAMRVNDYLAVDFELTTVYDRNISPEAQVKEVLSVGLTFVFI